MVLLALPSADHLLIERARGQFVPSRRRRMMANARAERLLKIPAEPSPELRIPGAAAQTRVVSMAGIRLDSPKSVRAFKGIICDDISEFESHMPSQAVGSPGAPTPPPRYRGSGLSKLRERPPASRGNPHAGDFDPAPAGDHALDARRREPGVDQLDQELGLEPVGQHDRLGAAVDGCLEQFERQTALLLRG